MLKEVVIIMSKTRMLIVAFCAVVSFAPSAQAQPISEALQACSAESNSLKRLVCFDCIVKNMRQYDGLDETVATRLPASAPAPKVTAVPRTNNEAENFGLKEKAEASFEGAQMVDGKLVAMVTSSKQVARNKYQFTLDNGQVWEQTESGVGLGGVPKAGDRVNIKSGMLGAFFISKEGMNKRFRVKRLQ